MKKQDTVNKILALTTKIKTNYPELYVLLDENPITIPSVIHPTINNNIMQDYLDSLKQILDHYIKTHHKA
jgi:hypothetical protein